MLPRLRRSLFGKFIIFGTVIICCLFYFKVINKNLDILNDIGLNDGNGNINNIAGINDDELNENSRKSNDKNIQQDNFLDQQQPQQYQQQLEKSINPLERSILNDLSKQVPGLGDSGESVVLEGEAKLRGDEKLAHIALNEELSEHLSYNRTTPDVRHPLCKEVQYDLNTLPKASIIIIFYNEPYSVLLRTVHSVLNTVDRRILKEIILVDDGSPHEELHEKLDYYIETRLPADAVKLIRLKHRLGLIRARLAGAREARGDVLMFLDAHCECVRQWLEPLLKRIQDSRTSVLVPIIDVIDAKDFQYSSNGYRFFQVGGFSWNGHFDWVDVPKREQERKKRECKQPLDICPTYSPTMAGGLFAISRDYFWEVGSYDEQMDGWGGENLEMSFRIWQCGGTIETIPCSRVGHIFRDFHPYSFPGDRDTHGINTIRMALVWMDEYINLIYIDRPDLKDHPETGDVTHRKMLRRKLKCKSFDWYLKNIYPEKFIPNKNMLAYGRIMALTKNLCLDDLQQNNEEPYNLGLYHCHRPNLTKSQFFSLTRDGILRNELSCATVQKSSSPPYFIVMAPCHNKDKLNERWIYSRGQLIHVTSGMCLDHIGLQSQDHAQVGVCSQNSETQKWKIEH